MLRLRLAAGSAAALALSALVATPINASTTPASTAAPAQNVARGKPAAAPPSSGSWTVYHHDDAHTGNDSSLPAAQGASAGWVSGTMDGTVLAEPLVFQGMVYAVTLQGTLYAFNQSTGTTAWSLNVGTPKSWSNQCGNINPLGISGTPVIDPNLNRIYVSEILSTETHWRVFGIDLSTHQIVLSTLIPTTLGTGWDWTIEQERGALGLANGYVYVPFGGRAGDCGAYHGWIYAVPVDGSPVTKYYETPGQGAGFWTAGGVVIDDSTGKVFETSGNGTGSGCNAVSTGGPPVFENDAVVRLSATLAHEDAFIPQDWKASWCDNDQDLGSASMVLISPTLAFQSGKWGTGFLVNPQALGGQDGQLFPTPKPAAYSEMDVCRGNHSDANFGSYAYAAPYVYLGCEGNGLVALSVNTGAHTFSGCGSTCGSPSWNATGFSPGPPIVAAGAVWAVDTGGGGLYGFDVATGAQIYHSAGFGVNHFTTPSEAGGQVFVGSDTVVRSFNILSGCTSVALSASPPASATAGTTVVATATATGPSCVNPQYEFWLRPASNNNWTMQRAYSTTNTWSWTSTNVSGGYWIGVHARTGTSNAPWEALGSIPYSINPASCSSVGISGSPPSPQVAGTQVTFTATASGCPNPSPLYQFLIRPASQASWQVVRTYSTSPTFSWDSSGFSGTVYVGVWTKDAGSSAFADAYTSTPYVVNPVSCASVSISGMPGSPQVSGTQITFTATASGCTHTSPLYQFLIRPASQSTWQVVRTYSTNATFNWNSGGFSGTVYVGAWTKDSGSAATYDAVISTPYVINPASCASVTISASPASPIPHGAGTLVTFTGVASGCSNPNPLYEFWFLDSGTWRVVQGWSTTASWTWNTTGAPAGTQHLGVWVRDAASPGVNSTTLGSYDAYAPIPYTLS